MARSKVSAVSLSVVSYEPSHRFELFSEISPSQGTLQVFPSVLLSNSYLILRPFFTPLSDDAAALYDPSNWKYGTFQLHELLWVRRIIKMIE